MSRAVILAINAKYVHSSLSAWMLAAGVSQYARLPHAVTVVEATINQQLDDIAKQVAAHRPDVVGVSTYIWNAAKLPKLLALLRDALPQTVFVLGGPEAAHNAAYWLDCGADFVICGEGEYRFAAFLDAVAEGKHCDLKGGPVSGTGLAHHTGQGAECAQLQAAEGGHHSVNDEPASGIKERFSHGQGASCVQLQAAAECVQLQAAELLDPYSADFFDALGGRIAYIETSRGCPFRCAFCLSGASDVRFFPLDTAKEQLRKLSRSGTQTVKFVDRTFNCNVKRAYELFEFVIGLDTACCFHFEVAADLFDAPTLALLRTAPAGRIQLEAGLQSFFAPALKASSRQTDLDKAERNIRAILDGQNIHVHLDLIAGLPHERLPDFAQGFDRAYAIGAHTLQLGFLKLLHGSALRARETEIICAQEPPYEILHSPWLAAADIATLKKTENALQHTYNKGRFLSALRCVLAVTEMRPFAFYRMMGEAVANHATPLKDYAADIYRFCIALAGVDADTLRGHMICDWLGMSKGANMPEFLRVEDKRRKQAAETAQRLLGRKLRRHEVAMLPSGTAVFVDSESRDAVTGLYKIHKVEL